MHSFKVAATRGYVFLGVALICMLTLVILAFIYGDLKSISTDPSDPLVLNGTLNYMEKSAREKYRSATHTISAVGFLNAGLFIIVAMRRRRREKSATQETDTRKT
jgi:hypothetical protein